MNEMITDIGIDLGNGHCNYLCKGQGIVLKEPSVVAYDTRSGKVLCSGSGGVYDDRPHARRICAVKPLDQG